MVRWPPYTMATCAKSSECRQSGPLCKGSRNIVRTNPYLTLVPLPRHPRSAALSRDEKRPNPQGCPAPSFCALRENSLPPPWTASQIFQRGNLAGTNTWIGIVPCGPSIAGACRETRATQQGRLAGSALICRRQNWSREETTMNRAILCATLAGALVFVTSICWTQSWAQDQGRPPAPPALVGMGLPEVPPEQVGMSKQKLDRIHDALKQHVADGKLPGTVVLVARKGKLIYADVTGFQDKDEGKPMALDSLFRIYSMTKPLVSVAAMMLVEDGTIQLTDPVSKFFPAFKGQQVSVARSDNELARMSYITIAAEREMTVQDLLRHTAGLAYGEITVNAPVRDAYAKAGLYLAGVRDYDARELTPAEEVERLAKAPLAHQPGTVWEYSMAVDLLGRVVEAASGKRLTD